MFLSFSLVGIHQSQQFFTLPRINLVSVMKNRGKLGNHFVNRSR